MAKGKKGKKGKKSKQLESAPVVKEEVLTEVEHTFYKLTIEDIKRKILRLRAHIQNLDVANESIARELHGLQKEKKGEAGELSNEVDEINANITKMRNENAKLAETYYNEKRRSEETIGDLELKYKAMHDQLCAEIKRLNGKLNACEEFRLNRDMWMVKFEERADELVNKEAEAEDMDRQMKAKSVYEREMLKEELLGKLTLAGEEFTGAGATNSSDLNLRLIRENIALQKNIDMLVNSNNEMDERVQQELALYASNKALIPQLEKRNRCLIKESQEKLNIIKTVNDEVHKLKQEYIAGLSYREQNISIKEFQICARFRRQKLKKCVGHVGQQLNDMEHEINLYNYLIEQYQKERENIEEHLENLRLLIEHSIGMTNVEQSQFSSKSSLESNLTNVHCRGNLLNQLVGLLCFDFDLLDTGRRGSLDTLKPYEKLTRFDQLFKKEAPSLTSLMDLCVTYIDNDYVDRRSLFSISSIGMGKIAQHELKEYETILPAQRPLGKNYIFDIESGTSLYYSSELEDPERMEVEEQGAGGEEQGSESSSEAPKAASEDEESSPKEKKEKRMSSAAAAATTDDISGASKLPPGTIVDVVTDVESDEHEESAYEPSVEDEEYDINLFY